jgi:hypothetical protein
MSSKIIYPILIIIFSILIIYGIINNKNNSKLNSNFENFLDLGNEPSQDQDTRIVNYYLNENNENLLTSNVSNTLFTSNMINGSWTCDLTTVDSTYNVQNTMTISSIEQINSSNYNKNITNYGTVVYNNQTYTINFLLNDNLTAVLINSQGVPSSQNLHIKFYNNFSNEGKEIINAPFYKPEEFNSEVSIYSNNTLINKFVSYKIYDNKVGDELYRIITTRDFYIEKAAPVYDYDAYKVIIGKYKFPSNFITLSFGTTNTNVLNTLNTKYFGTIKFFIQRVFYSPTSDNAEIITNISDSVLLQVVSNNQIPTTITICSFQNDQNTNGLESFFKPKATILYFYKYINTDSSYVFGNTNKIDKPRAVLNIKNNANLITPKFSYDDLGSVQKVAQNNYSITLVNRYNSNLTNTTNINFSDLYNLL